MSGAKAANICTSAVLEGDEWVINGEKHYVSGAGDPRCKVMICMCRTSDDDARHAQHSQILVPMDAPGVEIVRPMNVFASDDAPHGHMHIRLTDVRVPEANVILGPGRGFEIAQGRLGPGRIHHCMRAIGMAERALELMCRRAVSRTAFGKPLAQLGANHDIIAECRMEIEMARLLCLKAAWYMDRGDARAAADHFLRIRAAAPTSSIRPTAEYDAAAALIAMQDWGRASGALEEFRRNYPDSQYADDVTQSLAVSYLEAGQGAQAAGEFVRIANAPGSSDDVKRDALWRASDLYKDSGNVAQDVGGGLRSLGNVTVLNSTMSGNASVAWHGGAAFLTDGRRQVAGTV